MIIVPSLLLSGTREELTFNRARQLRPQGVGDSGMP